MSGARAIVAVLAGGRATRLGGAGKAALRLAGDPLIYRPLAAARDAGLEVLVVAKPRTALPPLRVRVLREPEQPAHPLCGVLAALDFLAAERPRVPAALVLGCDMPFVTGALLRWLAAQPGPVAARARGREQPLLARWPVSARETLARALFARSSLRAALAQLQPRIVTEPELQRFGDPRLLCFNVNDAADLERARRELARAR